MSEDRTYRVVFLDIDDTLLDFRANARRSMERTFVQFGLPFSEDRFRLFEVRNLALWKRLERRELTKEQLFELRWKTILDEMGLKADAAGVERVFLEELEDAAVTIAGAEETVRRLASRYRLVAASNGMLRQQTNRLAKAGLLPFFEHLFVSESVGAEKPSKQFFDACFETLGDVDPSEAVLIGDSLSADIRGAVSYGLPCIWFNRYGEKTPPPEGVLCAVEDLRQLASIL